MDSKRSVIMGKYELGRLLGQGTFAKVYYARHLVTGQSVAIKVIDKEKVMRVGLMDQVKREISVMKLVRHPNIVQLFEVMATKTKIYFVLEYIKGGELFDRVAKRKLKEDVGRKFFQQLISAVDFCHSRGVYHRDLKPENVLLDEKENLKVTDFGLSALAESKCRDGLLHTTCGTPAYVAPEVITRKGYDGAKADIWSCGVILFVLLAGYLPFRDSNLIEMYRKIARADYKCPGFFPDEVRKLLSKILNPVVKNRISMSEIKENSWFKNGLESEPTKMDCRDMVSFSCSGENTASSSRGKQAIMMSAGNLNAFDIISLSAGFDLSSLFEERGRKRETRFTSRAPAPVIISALENMAKTLNLSLKKEEKGLLKFEDPKQGRKGKVSIETEIFEVNPSFHLVEMKKCSGDTLEYQKIMQESIRPGLEDIVWAWQGDKNQQQLELPPEISANQPSSQQQQMP